MLMVRCQACSSRKFFTNLYYNLYGSWMLGCMCSLLPYRVWYNLQLCICYIFVVLFRFFFFFFFCIPFFGLVFINWTEWSMIPACPNLFNKGSIEGTKTQNKTINGCMCLYVCYILFYISCMDWVWIFYFRNGFHIWEEFWSVNLLMVEFNCPEVTAVGRTLESNNILTSKA